MARPNSPVMLPKRTKMVRLGISIMHNAPVDNISSARYLFKGYVVQRLIIGDCLGGQYYVRYYVHRHFVSADSINATLR